MVSNHKATGKASSLPAGLAFGIATSLGITVLISIILGKLLDLEKISWENIGYAIMILLLISSYLGALMAYWKVKRQRLPVCLMSGVLYFGALLLITALFFGGQFQAIGVTAGLILAGAATAGILESPQKRGGRSRKRRITYR